MDDVGFSSLRRAVFCYLSCRCLTHPDVATPMSEHLPAKLNSLHADAKKAKDRIETFRAYVKLLNAGYRVLEKAKEEARKADREVHDLLLEFTFFQRHKAKVETAFKALRDTYASPARALRMIDDLCANYPAQYVYEVCHLGAYRFGGRLGWAFLGLRSASRVAAEQNYADVVIPALAQMLPEHADYLELRSKDVEQLYEAALADTNRKHAVKAAIEAALPTWSEEMTACARTLTNAEQNKLSSNEREVRRRLIPVQAPKAAES